MEDHQDDKAGFSNVEKKPSDLRSGDVVIVERNTAPMDRYETVGVLGAGGMGEVELWRDVWIGREVAAKSMHSSSAHDQVARARFEREARVQARLEHPSIVPVYEIGERPTGEAFFIMKRVRGVSLEHVIDDLRGGDLETSANARPRLLRAFSSACLAVAFANSRGVIHRDLKPSNVMLGEFGEVNVLDWGIAKVVSEDSGPASLVPVVGEAATSAGALLGTLGYMAPEQADDASAVDARADV